LKNKEKRSGTYRPKGNSDEGNASVATTTDISDCSEVLLAFAGCANNGDDGTQYYGYPKTTITSDFHGTMASGVFLVAFWIYFHAGKRPQNQVVFQGLFS
jgi:hypothetical protein